MKYMLALLGGILAGVVLFGLLLYVNPFAKAPGVSPLAVSQSSMLELTFSAVPDDTVATIYSSKARPDSHPVRVEDLWDPALANTKVTVTALRSSRGQPRAIGVKFSSLAKEAGLLQAKVPVNSNWHMWMLNDGGLFIDQTENLWFLLRDVIVPAYLGSEGAWRGTWYGIETIGPGALGTGRVTGGSGKLNGVQGEAVESAIVRAYQADRGPVAMDVNLTLSLPATE